jgi:morphogenetic protein associated with SpoVID
VEVHIVQKGDTLWKIARQYGVSFDELKKVNAHLANPDYIVPGMKIFLPAKVKKTQPIKKETKPPKIKEPIPLPPTVAEEEITEKVTKPTTPPIPPIPMLPPEQPVPFPIESPAPPESPVMMPHPYPVPMPMPGVPQYSQPFGCIPCVLLPIYDADCYPYMYGSTHHHQAPPYATQMPMPPIPMYDMEEVSPLEPILEIDEFVESPMQMPRPEGWKMIESPEFMTEEFTLPVAEQPIAPPPPQPYYESPGMYQGYPQQQPTYESAMPIYGSVCNCGPTYPMMAPAYTQNLCASCHKPMHFNPYYQMNSPMYCSICNGYH